MKKILICGATGFIGRNVAKRLSKNKNIELHLTRFKRPEYPLENAIWHQIDLRNSDLTDSLVENMDIIIQAAAVTSGANDILNKPHIHVTDNAVINSYLFRSAHKSNVKHIIFFSCSIIYESSIYSVCEDDFDSNKILHQSYFGAGYTKIYLEKMCEFFSNIGSTKYTVIRHSNIYGPHDKFNLENSHVFGATLSKVMVGSQKILVWGSGVENRDLLYVDDLIDFIELAMCKQTHKFKIFNCGFGEPISILDLAQTIIKLSEKKLQITFDSNSPNINSSIFLNCDLAERELGWKPKISLERGIELTMDWWITNIDPKTLAPYKK